MNEQSDFLTQFVIVMNAVRVPEHIVLPVLSTEEVEHFNSQGVQCPLYLCCSRMCTIAAKACQVSEAAEGSQGRLLLILQFICWKWT